MKYGTWLVVAAAMALLCTVPGVAEDKTFDKTFAVSPGGKLYLTTDIGSVKITGGSGSEVVVKVVVRGSSTFVRDFDISAWQEGGDVHVKGEAPKSIWKMFSGGDREAVFTISVPTKYSIEGSTAGGDVTIMSIEGTVKASTSGGDVSTKDVVGNVSLGTSGGDVGVMNVEGMVEAETSGGDVTISGVKGDVKGETSGGNVKVENVEGAVNAETSGGNVRVTVRGGNKGVHAETSGGNVEIVLAPNVSATVDAATSGGSVECDLPVTVQGKIRESSIKGTINGGGPLIYAHTSGGNVRIRSSSASTK